VLRNAVTQLQVHRCTHTVTAPLKTYVHELLFIGLGSRYKREDGVHTC